MKNRFLSFIVIGLFLSNASLGMEAERRSTAIRSTLSAHLTKELFGDKEKQQQCVKLIKTTGYNTKSQWDMVKYYMDDKHLGKLSAFMMMSMQIKTLTDPETGESLKLGYNNETRGLLNLFTIELKPNNDYNTVIGEISKFKQKLENRDELYTSISDEEREEQVYNLQKLAAYFLVKMSSSR